MKNLRVSRGKTHADICRELDRLRIAKAKYDDQQMPKEARKKKRKTQAGLKDSETCYYDVGCL